MLPLDFLATCMTGGLFANTIRSKFIRLHFLGDSAFQLKTYVMVPFKDLGKLTLQQQTFNFKLSQSRQTIERAFGMLKTRYRVLKHLEVDIENSSPIIKVCCILHNYVLKKHSDVHHPVPQTYCNTENMNENQKRNTLCTFFS